MVVFVTYYISPYWSVPVAALSKALVYGRSPTAIVGSNSTGAWMFVCCVCCQVEVSATSWSLVHRRPTECGAFLCVIKNPRERRGHSPRWAAKPKKINKKFQHIVVIHIHQTWYVLGQINCFSFADDVLPQLLNLAMLRLKLCAFAK
jgi:hypothetical protein